MAVSQNIARLRALLNGFSISNATITTLSGSTVSATTLSGSRLCLTDAEAVTALGGGSTPPAGGTAGQGATLSVITGVSRVTTAAASGSVFLPSGQAVGQLKYVILDTKAGDQSLHISASTSNGVGVTGSIVTARQAMGFIYDGTSWNVMTTGSVTYAT